MSGKAFDYKREYRDLYLPKNEAVLIEAPLMNFLMVDGSGDPNHNSEFNRPSSCCMDSPIPR